MFSRPVLLVLNVAMIVCIYFYSDVHERRVFYADKVVGQALKLVLTHAGIFVTTQLNNFYKNRGYTHLDLLILLSHNNI